MVAEHIPFFVVGRFSDQGVDHQLQVGWGISRFDALGELPLVWVLEYCLRASRLAFNWDLRKFGKGVIP